jgi:hypothetical protein
MGEDSRSNERRSVLVHTIRGPIEGHVRVNHGVRTLDWLNLTRRFVPLEASDSVGGDWPPGPGRVGLNKALIQFVAELCDQPETDPRVEATHYSREAVSLKLEDCDVTGYLHVRDINDPLLRLSRSDDSFIALTSASAVGPDFELAATFLAVNPAHVLCIRLIDLEDDESFCDTVVAAGL